MNLQEYYENYEFPEKCFVCGSGKHRIGFDNLRKDCRDCYSFIGKSGANLYFCIKAINIYLVININTKNKNGFLKEFDVKEISPIFQYKANELEFLHYFVENAQNIEKIKTKLTNMKLLK